MRRLSFLLAAVALVVAFTAPAKADVSFYGYAAMETDVEDYDPGPPGVKSQDDLIWQLDEVCTRFGAVGQTWAADWNPVSSAKRGCVIMGGDGDSGGGVPVQMVEFRIGGLKLDLAQPKAAGGNVADARAERTVPKLVARYSFDAGPVALALWGGYNTYDEVDDATDKSYSFCSMYLGGRAIAGFGAATVKLALRTATNTKEYGMPINAPFAQVAGTEIKDVTTLAYGVDLGYKISDTLNLTLGYIGSDSKLNLPGDYSYPNVGYHANLEITLAPGVTITPEFFVIDQMDKTEAGAKTEQPVTTYFGANWKIAF